MAGQGLSCYLMGEVKMGACPAPRAGHQGLWWGQKGVHGRVLSPPGPGSLSYLD